MPHSDRESRRCLAIVLAAGASRRMRSDHPKVLHKLAGRSMLAHVLTSLDHAGADETVLIVGPDHDAVVAEAKSVAGKIEIAVQKERLGTAHAVLAARAAISRGFDDLLIVFADTPLVLPETFLRLRKLLAGGQNAVGVLGFETEAPAGYGRLILAESELLAIREDQDATGAELNIKSCNAGLMALDGHAALALLDAIGNANSRKEYYLTDVVAVARSRGLRAAVYLAPEAEVQGVNDRAQLAAAEAVLQSRLRARVMQEGTTLIDPSTVTLAFDTELGRDSVVEPHVVFGPGVKIGANCLIRSFSHIEGAVIGDQAIVGPFARLRPGTALSQSVHIGNFVEVKASAIGEATKINHLTYIGDAHVGIRTNVGAGTVTCNYDGFSKFKTEIGSGVFVGSHSTLVAPVKIGDGAYLGAGSVITKDVPEEALALGRSRQVEKPGWVKAFRAKKHK
ncbi:MAG: bifunctional UDP-N-acetylglucosamine diphosphorylase/glucosamine-1-phosphate N-acetyltransferase GlmU [Alphaproteobacteria bacterium]|nr:bifunctional UDP-N-acetylglucosamine diphosphorylase/glucosamine-1-phosphate N-acetyltransferase GlmU [Alphaproteobacteria bacterium]